MIDNAQQNVGWLFFLMMLEHLHVVSIIKKILKL